MGFSESSESVSYTTSGVDHIPNYAGVYGIFRRFVHGTECIYIGSATDLQARVTQHVTGRSKESRCINGIRPNIVIWERVPFDLIERERELYKEYKDKGEAACNEIAPA